MSSSSPAWAGLCERLNVKPKQFAILLVITVSALGVLGLKMFVLKPSKAGAATTEAKAHAADAGGHEADAVAAGAAGPTTAAISHGLPIVAVSFETRPVRDPFIPFFVYDSAKDPNRTADEASGSKSDGAGGVLVAPRTGHAVPPSKGKADTGHASAPVFVAPPTPSDGPQGIVLKAIISGRVAVINNTSVEAGDVVQDESAQNYTVAEVRERSIILSDGRRRFTIGYTAMPVGGAKPTGTKAAAAKPVKK